MNVFLTTFSDVATARTAVALVACLLTATLLTVAVGPDLIFAGFARRFAPFTGWFAFHFSAASRSYQGRHWVTPQTA